MRCEESANSPVTKPFEPDALMRALATVLRMPVVEPASEVQFPR